ncbi:MAG TPA: DUF1499 domain-containing protein [Gammaproteobacteria bacterium]
MFSSARPNDLGVRDGRLAPCKPTPNCVCSQADPADRTHYIEPIRGTIADARHVLRALPRVRIIRDEAIYIHAEFRTRLLRFVDDVELYFDGHVLHVRSCSRVGRHDLGTNRRRVESLRRLIEARR